MYNGIGLDTARGSGTNGYVQKNVAFIRRHKDRVDYKSEAELQKLDQTLNKGPNPEILDHDRKRKVELKCLEMQELMEEQGYSAEEIEKKVAIFRKMLTEKEGVSERAIDRDESGRPVAKETHQLAEAAAEKTQQLRAAFGLSEHYQDGSSFDPNRRAKEKELEAKAMAEKQYAVLRSSSSSRSPSPVPKKKKKKSNKSRSETQSPSRGRKKKSKKQKRERSESPKPREKHKQKKKKKHRSPSPSDSDSDSASDSDTDSSSGRSPENYANEKTTKNDKKIKKGAIEPLDDIDRSPSPVAGVNGNKTPASDRITLALASNNNNKKLTSISPHEKSRSVRSKPSRSRTPKSKRSQSKTPRRSRSRSSRRKRSKSRSRSKTPRRSRSRSSRRKRSRSRSRSPKRRRSSRSHSRSKKKRSRRRSSYSRSRSRSRSRSPSIRRRSGSPSHLDRRRITSARKCPIPYHRPTPPSPSSDDSWSPVRSRSRRRSRSLVSLRR